MLRTCSAIVVDIQHAIVDEIDLALAVQLAQDRVADQLPVEADDARLDGQAIRRRRFQIGDIADAEQRQMQRARNRRRGHRQHVDFLPQPFEPLLVLDAETLLLVDDDQTQILELHVGTDESMRADDDIDAALRQPIDDALLLAGSAEAAQTFDDEWILREPLAEGADSAARRARSSAPAPRPAGRCRSP